jgi:hypothetical protein
VVTVPIQVFQSTLLSQERQAIYRIAQKILLPLRRMTRQLAGQQQVMVLRVEQMRKRFLLFSRVILIVQQIL